ASGSSSTGNSDPRSRRRGVSSMEQRTGARASEPPSARQGTPFLRHTTSCRHGCMHLDERVPSPGLREFSTDSPLPAGTVEDFLHAKFCDTALKFTILRNSPTKKKKFNLLGGLIRISIAN